MSPPASRISLADLAAAGVHLRPVDAVTIARELVRRASCGDLPGVPSPHVVRFAPDGTIAVEGPVAAGVSIERAVRLLEAMLPGFEAPPERRVPGALRLVLARAAGTLDLPRYPTLDAFNAALARFGDPDPSAIVRELVAAWHAAMAVSEQIPDARTDTRATTEITVSDVRRARRATGLTLADIAERSRIPVSLLRELEWGYFVNWPAGHYGRSQLVRYARAAGLDEHVVIRAVLPDITATGASIEPPQVIDVPADGVTSSLVRVQPLPTAVVSRRKPRRAPALATAAVVGLLAVAFVPAIWLERDESAGVSEAMRSTAPAGSVAAERSIALPPDHQVTSPDTRERVRRSGNPDPNPRGPDDSQARSSTDARPMVQPAALRSDAAFSPAFASAGSAMFYHAEAADRSAIVRADTTAGGEILRVTRVVDDRAQNFHARPSPDGSSIAFDSDRDGERAVYVADADGRNVRRITGPGFAAVPSWSPDGRRLAYVRAEADRPKVWNLWLVDLETGEPERLTNHRIGQPWGAAWFPDGRRIAYSHEDRIIVRSIDGSQQRIYPSPRKGRLVRTPAVSPDGRRIVFQVYRDGAWMMNVGTGSMQKILSDASAEEFTWAPDGRRIAYHSRRTGEWGVWIMTAR